MRVAKRWRYLILIGAAIALIDQGTKFLAVRALTPGIGRAYLAEQAQALPRAEQPKAIDEIPLLEQLRLFYRSVHGPCQGPIERIEGLGECPTVTVVEGLWNWHYVENKGAAWGLLATASETVRVPFFILVSLGAITFILTFFRKLPDDQLLFIISLSLIFGGAVGNFVDRLHLNYVIDFVDWHVGSSHWPTFNFADAAITTGVGLIVVQWLRDSAQAKDAAKPKPTGVDSKGESAAERTS